MMGCGSSKNDVIKSAASSGNEPTKKDASVSEGTGIGNGDTRQNGNVANARSSSNKVEDKNSPEDSLTSSLLSEGSTIPASEKFGNGTGNQNNNGGLLSGGSGNSRTLPELPPLKPPRTSKVGFVDQNNSDAMAEGNHEKNVPIAFEVPAEEDASLIKKHPPRRLRQLEERPPDAVNITQEALEEKVALANERRNQVLNQRVASARQKSARTGRIRRPMMESELEASETMESPEGAGEGE